MPDLVVVVMLLRGRFLGVADFLGLVTKSYKIIGFGALDVTKPYNFIGFGA